MNIKELSQKEEKLASGHRLCPGCAQGAIVRQVLMATEDPVIATNATGCLEVSTSIYPYTSWKIPWMHNAFENASPTMAGIETAYNAFKKKGKIKENIKFVTFGGDGGTYDIGFQSLSATLERGHDFMYVCCDNEAYMNTGIQRSSATPHGAATKTTPAGKVKQGKQEYKKDLTKVVVAHNIPYVAQASPHNYADLIRKAKIGFETKGPTFLNVLSPCVPGWGYSSEKTMEIAKLAVETCFWPLFEVVNGEWKLNYDPKDKKKPIEEWLKTQTRFRHLFKPGNEHIIQELQDHVDKEWEELKKRCNAN